MPQVRRAMGFAFGAAGRAIYSGLVLWDSQVRLLAPSLWSVEKRDTTLATACWEGLRLCQAKLHDINSGTGNCSIAWRLCDRGGLLLSLIANELHLHVTMMTAFYVSGKHSVGVSLLTGWVLRRKRSRICPTSLRRPAAGSTGPSTAGREPDFLCLACRHV